MKQRVILHSDMNNFYAGVECHHRPEIRNKPVVVGGDEEQRHGIVLAKNYLAMLVLFPEMSLTGTFHN